MRKKAKSRPERVGRGIPACSGLSEEKEKSSNEVIFKGELFSAKNNIAYPSEKSKKQTGTGRNGDSGLLRSA